MVAKSGSAGFKLARVFGLLGVLFGVLLMPVVGRAEGYGNALKGLKKVSVVFDVSQGNPKTDNVVFWAVKNVYEDTAVKALPENPSVAVVFHGAVVKLLSTDQDLFTKEDWPEVEKFQNTLRQMKKDGVALQVCMYAVKVMRVDPATLLKEVDQVPNGFVSVAGFQNQGYAVVRLP